MSDRRIIVVGCDGNPRSDPALRFAAAEAGRRQARLIIVAAYPGPNGSDSDDSVSAGTKLQAGAQIRADRSWRRALGQAVDSRSQEIFAAQGDPAKLLLEQGREALMIVIGRTNRPTLLRLFGHHTGDKLLRRAVVPVVIVPDGSGLES